MPSNYKELLKKIPSVESAISHLEREFAPLPVPRPVAAALIRERLDSIRSKVSAGEIKDSAVLEEMVLRRIEDDVRNFAHGRLREVINATGIVIHTNLGRAPLDDRALKRAMEVMGRYCNLEMDLATGKRTSRHRRIGFLLRVLTSAEGAHVVNNNAAAVLLALNTIAKGKEVIVSRGQLVEIGGSFRLPEVMTSSGAVLREVGTTNRTNIDDYACAIGSDTAAIMVVHLSNFVMSGYVQSVDVSALVDLAKRSNIPVIYDLGSGTIERIEMPGTSPEPSVSDALGSGASVVTFSGDKLLGGPQAGIILGHGELIEAMRSNPMSRALRVDKSMLAALEGALETYLEGPREQIPVLRMLHREKKELAATAGRIADGIASDETGRVRIAVVEEASEAGGGSLPGLPFMSEVVSILPERLSAEELVSRLRLHEPPVVARVKKGHVLLDARTIMDDQIEGCIEAVIECLRDD
jgi:L-seryl-tRNA(Ser) seleniumtransferase